MSKLVVSKIRNPSRPSRHTNAKSFVSPESRLAASIASNCRCVSPRVGDWGETVGRRT